MIVHYDESILAYIASIRNYYKLDSSYHSNIAFDNILKERNPKKIYITEKQMVKNGKYIK